jgi:hypothetical protein
MKTVNENWKELFKDELNQEEMFLIRGGDGGDEDPDDPILK